MQSRQEDIKHRLEKCKKQQGTLLPVLLDVEFLLAALQEIQNIIKIANDDFTENCLFYKSPLTNGKCPHIYKGCQMHRTCEALMKLDGVI